jgi:hypothetical protein
MSPRQASRYYSVSKKWLALVERRKQYFIDLCDSGRWKFYFDSEDEVREQMRNVIMLRLQWVRLVDEMSTEAASVLDPGVASDLAALAQADLVQAASEQTDSAEEGVLQADLLRAQAGLLHAAFLHSDLAQDELAQDDPEQDDPAQAAKDDELFAA